MFSQILQQVPRPLFERVVAARQGERHSRGFCCWDQFVSILFCQLGQAQSLREIYEIYEGLQASEGKLVHLGMKKSPASRHTYLRQ